jgi:hypothetical protein
LEWSDLANGMIHVRAKPPQFGPKTHEERRIPVDESPALDPRDFSGEAFRVGFVSADCMDSLNSGLLLADATGR